MGIKSKMEVSACQRHAALKALETMKRSRWSKQGRTSQKIDKFMTLNQVAEISHHKTGSVQQEQKISYSKGIVSLFHKTPLDMACGKFWELRWAYGCPLTATTVIFVEQCGET